VGRGIKKGIFMWGLGWIRKFNDKTAKLKRAAMDIQETVTFKKEVVDMQKTITFTGGTGVFSTQEEAAKFQNAWIQLRERTSKGFSGWQSGGGIQSLEQEVWHLAVKHGLPMIYGFYGLNFETREFIFTGEAHLTNRCPFLMGAD